MYIPRSTCRYGSTCAFCPANNARASPGNLICCNSGGCPDENGNAEWCCDYTGSHDSAYLCTAVDASPPPPPVTGGCYASQADRRAGISPVAGCECHVSCGDCGYTDTILDTLSGLPSNRQPTSPADCLTCASGRDVNVLWEGGLTGTCGMTPWIDCVFEMGDGIGGTEEYLGDTRTAGDCIHVVHESRPNANGVKYGDASLYGWGCYAEFGMTNVTTGRLIHSASMYQTCIITVQWQKASDNEIRADVEREYERQYGRHMIPCAGGTLTTGPEAPRVLQCPSRPVDTNENCEAVTSCLDIQHGLSGFASQGAGGISGEELLNPACAEINDACKEACMCVDQTCGPFLGDLLPSSVDAENGWGWYFFVFVGPSVTLLGYYLVRHQTLRQLKRPPLFGSFVTRHRHCILCGIAVLLINMCDPLNYWMLNQVRFALLLAPCSSLLAPCSLLLAGCRIASLSSSTLLI